MFIELIKRIWKQALCLILLLGTFVAISLFICRNPRPASTGTFFPADRNRFIVIDTGWENGAYMDVVYDRYTGVMYLHTYSGGFSPLYQEDGNLMIYDES